MAGFKEIVKRATLFMMSFALTASLVAIVPSSVGAASGFTSSSSSTPEAYLRSWGPSGVADGELVRATGVAISPNGQVYVTDTGNNRIQIFTADGVFMKAWGSLGSGDGQFNAPDGIAISPIGEVYVADNRNSRIQVFSAEGDYLRQWGEAGNGDGQLSRVQGIGISSINEVYVTDFDNSRVQVFTTTGDYLRQWGTSGSGEGQFVYAGGIAISPAGEVYVTDPLNYRVQVFNAGGEYLREWGLYGSGNGEFEGMYGIAVSLANDVYVVDPTTARIQVFTTDGDFLRTWGSEGEASGEFYSPVGIAVVPSGNVYVVDTDQAGIQVFGRSQNLGTVVAEGPAGSIGIMLPGTNNITEISSLVAPEETGFTYPHCLIDFTFSTTAGATVPITLTFETSLKPSEVTLRKYDPTTGKYTAVPDAVITQITKDGKPALQAVYSITDGNELDADGVANGVIVDPVGLAVALDAGGNPVDEDGNPVAADTILGVPNTGVGQQSVLGLIMIVLAGVSVAGLGIATARRRSQIK